MHTAHPTTVRQPARLARLASLVALTALTALAVLGAAPGGRAQDESDTLHQGVAAIEVRLDKKRDTAGRLEAKLCAPVRRALNTWAELAHGLGMAIVVPKHAAALVIGPCDEGLLRDAAGWLDETWALFEDLPAPATGSERAAVAFLIDEQGYGSEAWPALLDAFLARNLITREARDPLARGATGLTLRDALVFVQPTFDIAGNASAGDDEFRLGNEVAHKAAWCLVRDRFGQVPEMLRWGLGYVAEQRLFGAIYQFDRVGFVATADHFDWPKQAAASLAGRADTSLARLALQPEEAGRASTPQRLVWGALDYMLEKRPEALATMLEQLAALQAEAAPHGPRPTFVGDAERARAILEEHLDALDLTAVAKHVKSIKS